MSARSNEDIIRIVKKWQDGPLVHELNCAKDIRHPPLEPVERGGKVVLLCLKCGYAQEHVPEEVLGSEAALDYAATRSEDWARRQQIGAAINDVWWAAAIIMLISIVFGALFLGLPGGVLGAGVGACIAGPYATRKLRKIEKDFASRP